MNTITVRQLNTWIPEIYLILSIAFYWLSTATLFNGIAIALIALVVALIRFKSRALGTIIGTVFLLLSLYMAFALISELKNFTSMDGKAITLLMVGGAWLGLNTWMAIRMQIKWASPGR